MITRAIRDLTGVTMNYADANKFNLADQGQINADKLTDWRLKLADTHKELRGLSEATKEEIAIAIEAGATTEQLTNKYGLSAGALELLADKQKAAAVATAQHTREADAQAAALEKAYAQVDVRRHKRQPARDHGTRRRRRDRRRLQ